MTHVSANLVQQDFRGRVDDDSEAAATWVAGVNQDWTQEADEVFRVRVRIEETAGGPANNRSFIPQFSINGGAFANVNDTTPVRFAPSAFVASNTATTQQIGNGTFVPGEFLSNTDAGNVTLENSETEMEYCLLLDSTQISDGDTIQIRATDAGTELDGYSSTPTITAVVEVGAVAAMVIGQPADSGATAQPGIASGGKVIAGVAALSVTAAAAGELVIGDPPPTFDVEWQSADLTDTGSETGITETFYDITGLSDGVTYSWRVRQVQDGVAGAWSEFESFQTLASIDVILTGIAAQSRTVAVGGAPAAGRVVGGASSLSVAQSQDGGLALGRQFLGGAAVSGASSGAGVIDAGQSLVTFDVEWQSDDLSDTGSEAGIVETFYDITGLTPGVTYSWRVRQVENGTAGAWSEFATFETDAAVNTVFVGLAAQSQGLSDNGGVAAGTTIDGLLATSNAVSGQGAASHGSAFSGQGALSAATSVAGTLVAGDVVPAVIAGLAAASKPLAQGGAVSAGAAIEGRQSLSGATAAEAQGANGFAADGEAAQSRALSPSGQIVAGDVVSAAITGARSESVAKAQIGSVAVAHRLLGLDASTSAAASAGHITVGVGFIGSASQSTSRAGAGLAFTGLVFDRPLKNTRVKRVSTEYTATRVTTDYTVRIL